MNYLISAIENLKAKNKLYLISKLIIKLLIFMILLQLHLYFFNFKNKNKIIKNPV
ncbi:hypothetical protein MCAV_07040 [[Mycoplasma] cavipharyngis]